MPPQTSASPVDIVMLGTFAAWRLGTIQARALPLARQLREWGIRTAIVTTPWDAPNEAGVVDALDRVPLINTPATSVRSAYRATLQQVEQVKRLNPRLVHVFKPKGFGGLAGEFLSRSLPLYIDADDWEGDGGWNRVGHYTLLQRRLFDRQERRLIRVAAGVTAASTILQRRAITLRGNDSTVWRVPNGLSAGWMTALKRSEPADTPLHARPAVLLYSRFEELGPDWIRCFVSDLEHEAPLPLTLKVIGDAGASIDIGGDCIDVGLMGYVPREELPLLLAQTDIAIIPFSDSIVARSKHSVKVLEVMAAGCAVVASDVGDIAEMVGPSGVLIPDDSPNGFARMVASLLRSSKLRTRLGQHARCRVERGYTIECSAERLRQAYAAAGVLSS
jgi:glycosyltransferase involved in cell wall biosynthesis